MLVSQLITYFASNASYQFILDSAASFGLGVPQSIPPSLKPQKQKKTVLVFSAGHPESVKVMVKNHQEYLSRFPGRLDSVAYTLSHRREHLKYRAFCVTNGTDTLPESTPVPSRNLKQTAFVFTGQGAQWWVASGVLELSSWIWADRIRVHMGLQLMADCPSFLANIQSMDRILQGLEHAPSWSMEGKSPLTSLTGS